MTISCIDISSSLNKWDTFDNNIEINQFEWKWLAFSRNVDDTCRFESGLGACRLCTGYTDYWAGFSCLFSVGLVIYRQTTHKHINCRPTSAHRVYFFSATNSEVQSFVKFRNLLSYYLSNILIFLPVTNYNSNDVFVPF